MLEAYINHHKIPPLTSNSHTFEYAVDFFNRLNLNNRSLVVEKEAASVMEWGLSEVFPEQGFTSLG